MASAQVGADHAFLMLRPHVSRPSYPPGQPTKTAGTLVPAVGEFDAGVYARIFFRCYDAIMLPGAVFFRLTRNLFSALM